MHDAFGSLLSVGDKVRIRSGTFADQHGEVVGYHWRPLYPKVRLIVFDRPTDAWFTSDQLERLETSTS